jgi:hypothetical protein
MATKKKEESKDLKPMDSNLLSKMEGMDDFAVTDGNRVGLEDMDRSDIKIPVLQLLQPLSEAVQEEKGKAGEFYNATTGESFAEVDTTLLSLTKTRVRWGDEYRKGAKPLCRSFDGNTGVGDPGGNCANCPLKDWGDDNTKPECSQGYNWLALNLDNNDVFRYTAISSGIKPTKLFLTDYMKNYSKYQLFIYKVKLSSIKEKNDKGTFYIPQYEIYDVHDKNTAAQAKNVLESYKDMLKEDLKKAVEYQDIEESDVYEPTEEDAF